MASASMPAKPANRSPSSRRFFLASGGLLRPVVSGLYVGGQILWLTTSVALLDSVGGREGGLLYFLVGEAI
jgi:hypothetical protein